MKKHMIMLIILLVGMPTLTYAQPQKAKGALMGLKRLEAKTQMGIDYETLMNMLSNVKFQINLLQESNEPQDYPELSKTILSAFQHFSNASVVMAESDRAGGNVGLTLTLSSPMGKNISKVYPNANAEISAGGAIVSLPLFRPDTPVADFKC